MNWDLATYPLWHGSAPMSEVISGVGPADLFVRGFGSWLEDGRGRRFLDARAGMSNMMLGYGRSDIAEAMYRQALDLPFAPILRHNRPAPIAIEYARKLCEVAPTPLKRVRFTHTGSSAVECALHMARRYHRNLGRSGRTQIISLRGSYHGSTLMTMAAGGEASLHSMFGPMPEGFMHVDGPTAHRREGADIGPASDTTHVGDPMTVIESDPSRIAALLIEPVMGHSAEVMPTDFMNRIREVCTTNEILLIFDEVFTGFGRTGAMFAADRFAVSPDIMCLSKGVAAGYAPMGAVLTTDEVFYAFEGSGRPHFAHGSTTDGHPVSCAAAAAVLSIYASEAVLENVPRVGDQLLRRLQSDLAQTKFVREVRGIGLLISIDLRSSDGKPIARPVMRRVASECLRRGVLIDYTNILTIIPPLTLREDEADLIAATVCEVLAELGEQHVQYE